MKRTWIVVVAWVSILAAGEELGPPIKVVDPGGPLKAPSDAVVLFDGTTLDAWTHRDGSPVKWTIVNGELICKTGSGDIFSKVKFRDAQIHVEFSTPNMPDAHGQARANSGVYLQSHYEIQILDSFRNPTYKAGSAGSVYGEHDPLVNVTRPPDQWQSYDIVFHAPRCDGSARVTKPARVTILQNGVLIQDEATISGPTGGGDRDHVCEPGPLRLQDHGYPGIQATLLRFRNVWLREL
jgi:hypothetical protein